MNWFRLKLFGPASSFRIGQAVVAAGETELMVVTEIHTGRKMRFPLLECRWYDRETRSTRRNLFPENMLTLFDWDGWRSKTKDVASTTGGALPGHVVA